MSEENHDLDMLAAEASTTERDVNPPSRAWAGSLVSNLVALEPGASYIMNREITELPHEIAQRTAELNSAKSRMRKTISGTIKRAKTIQVGAQYATESMTTSTETGRMFAMVIITRIDDADDEL